MQARSETPQPRPPPDTEPAQGARAEAGGCRATPMAKGPQSKAHRNLLSQAALFRGALREAHATRDCRSASAPPSLPTDAHGRSQALMVALWDRYCERMQQELRGREMSFDELFPHFEAFLAGPRLSLVPV